MSYLAATRVQADDPPTPRTTRIGVLLLPGSFEKGNAMQDQSCANRHRSTTRRKWAMACAIVLLVDLLTSFGKRNEYCRLCGKQSEVWCFCPMTRFYGVMDLHRECYDSRLSAQLRPLLRDYTCQHQWVAYQWLMFPHDLIWGIFTSSHGLYRDQQQLLSTGLGIEMGYLARHDRELARIIVARHLYPYEHASEVYKEREKFRGAVARIPVDTPEGSTMWRELYGLPARPGRE